MFLHQWSGVLFQHITTNSKSNCLWCWWLISFYEYINYSIWYNQNYLVFNPRMMKITKNLHGDLQQTSYTFFQVYCFEDWRVSITVREYPRLNSVFETEFSLKVLDLYLLRNWSSKVSERFFKLYIGPSFSQQVFSSWGWSPSRVHLPEKPLIGWCLVFSIPNPSIFFQKKTLTY